MDANGKNQTALTQTEIEEWGPTWINENEITFLRQIGDSIVRIKLDLKTKKETQLQHPTNCILDDKNVLYSMSSNHQLYSCKNDIFIINKDTDELLNITENIQGNALYPTWSNNGKNVVYTSNHLGSNDIFRYEIKSKKITQLTNSIHNNERGELSPNGKLLVYSSDYFEKGNQDIVIKNLETDNIENISKSPGMDLIARFSNDGKTIYYGSNKDGNWEIYSFDIENKKLTRLTKNNEFDGDPRVLKK